MPKQYDDHGVQFIYPDNWQLEVTASPELIADINLQSEGSCIWSVKILSSEYDLVDAMNQIVNGLTDGVEEVETNPIETELVGWDLRGVELNFFYLDFLVSARIVVARQQKKYLIFLAQGETQEFDKTSQVFAAITTSLLQHEESNLQTHV